MAHLSGNNYRLNIHQEQPSTKIRLPAMDVKKAMV